ncbi:hypothetical protein Hypma_013193 [Hypsizygus marmoreus]|uniref:Hemerythrin-like domain-containing protein n=1 Tax=Hypsizygus marmoreus TaxID=39966 RepID=A0A369JJ35_HYPMA|nr:hypothetical protein Hypma_013193 [Hypsizygus marmoreus]
MSSRTILRLASSPLAKKPFYRTLRPAAARLAFAHTMSSKTLLDAIKEDHQEMYSYYDEYKRASGDKDAQERWSNQLTWEIARHAVGEEIVVYPLMEKHLGQKGVELADKDRAEHQVVKDKLYNLESLTPGSDEHSDLLKTAMDELRKHNNGEENNDLPLLEPELGKDGSIAAATSFSRTKKFVPTRPHPSAPNKPPFETLAGLMAAPMDKLKDAFAKFPTEEMKEQAKLH